MAVECSVHFSGASSLSHHPKTKNIRRNMEITDITPFARCALELVLNSINAQASAIAIRIHDKKQNIQVVDNGKGISKKDLTSLCEDDTDDTFHRTYKCNISNLENNVLINIYKISSTLIIISKHQNSPETYMKVRIIEKFEIGKEHTLMKTESRPLSGTTVTIHGCGTLLHNHKKNISMICFLTLCVALINLKSSFSIRDNEKGKVIMRIAKQHDPKKILKLICGTCISHNHIWHINTYATPDIKFHGYIGLTKAKATQWVFLNNNPVFCPEVLAVILDTFIKNLPSSRSNNILHFKKDRIFVFFYITCKEIKNIFTVNNYRANLLLFRIKDVLDNIKSCINNIFTKNTNFYPKSIFNYVSQRPSIHRHDNNRQVPESKRSLHSYKTNLFRQMCNRISKSILHDTPIHRKYDTVFHIKGFGKYILKHGQKDTTALKNIINTLRKRMKKNLLKKNDILFKFEKYKTDKDFISIKNAKKLKFLKSKESKRDNINNNQSKMIARPRVTFSNSTDIIDWKIQLNKRPNKTGYINTRKKQKECVITSKINYLSKNKEFIKSEESKCNFSLKSYSHSISEWSNWSYHTDKLINIVTKKKPTFSNDTFDENVLKNYRHFNFLPHKLNTLLQCKNTKLTNIPSFSAFDKSILQDELYFDLPVQNVLYHQNMNVRPCKFAKKLCEFKIERQILESIKILNQINHQLIAALAIYNNTELLLLMDQHAIHERIRYETLLESYKTPDHKYFLTKRLSVPIVLEVSNKICSILLSNKLLLQYFGVKLSEKSKNTLSIYSVPKCFKKHKHDNMKLISTIEKLLHEITNNILNKNGINILPLSIHGAIAMEACHGAIKFGDPLTLKQCKQLMKELKNTKSPTRCAHGRPSIIPVLELTQLRKRCSKDIQKKLNLTSLKVLSRKYTMYRATDSNVNKRIIKTTFKNFYFC